MSVVVCVCVYLYLFLPKLTALHRNSRCSPFSRDSLSICAKCVCAVSVCVEMPFTAEPEERTCQAKSISQTSLDLSPPLSHLPEENCPLLPRCLLPPSVGLLVVSGTLWGFYVDFCFVFIFCRFAFFACLITRKTSDNVGAAARLLLLLLLLPLLEWVTVQKV